MIRSTARRALARVRQLNRRILDRLDPDYPPPEPVLEPEPLEAPSPRVVQIRPEATPNPHAMKFDVGIEVGSRTLNSAADAEGDPLAALFDLDGVVAVFAVTDFVTVLKSGDASWDELTPLVEEALRQALA